jgi:hypothetical protein
MGGQGSVPNASLNVEGTLSFGVGIAVKITSIWKGIQSWVAEHHTGITQSASTTTAGAGEGIREVDLAVTSTQQGHSNSTLTRSSNHIQIEYNNENNSVNNDPPLYYSYYFNRWGNLIKVEANSDGKSKVYVANDDNNFSFTGYDAEFVKRYVAVVVGEAAGREDAAGIGVVIMNRFKAKKDAGEIVPKDANWPANLGGEGQYDAIGAGAGHPYNEVMQTPMDEIFRNGLRKGYREKMEGALSALSKGTREEVNSWLGTPHFWEGKEPYDRNLKEGQSTFFTRNIKLKMIYFSGQAGGSYFFNYTDMNSYLQNRKWP